MNFKPIIVFDTETTGTDITKCDIVQIAAVAIDPRNLTIHNGSEFNAFMKPQKESIDQQTLEFHARRLKMTADEVLTMWEGYPEPKVVWPQFLGYLKRYHIRQDRQNLHTAPIPAGANIIKFDMPLVHRYNELHGEKTATGTRPLFTGRDRIDLLDTFFLWFENKSDITSHSMDFMRDYLGMPKDNAHDALQDVKDCAEIIIKFLKLHRSVASKVKFKDACKR